MSFSKGLLSFIFIIRIKFIFLFSLQWSHRKFLDNKTERNKIAKWVLVLKEVIRKNLSLKYNILRNTINVKNMELITKRNIVENEKEWKKMLDNIIKEGEKASNHFLVLFLESFFCLFCKKCEEFIISKDKQKIHEIFTNSTCKAWCFYQKLFRSSLIICFVF